MFLGRISLFVSSHRVSLVVEGNQSVTFSNGTGSHYGKGAPSSDSQDLLVKRGERKR